MGWDGMGKGVLRYEIHALAKQGGEVESRGRFGQQDGTSTLTVTNGSERRRKPGTKVIIKVLIGNTVARQAFSNRDAEKIHGPSVMSREGVVGRVVGRVMRGFMRSGEQGGIVQSLEVGDTEAVGVGFGHAFAEGI